MRHIDRACDALRPVRIERGYTRFAEGSVLVAFGETVVLCNATVENNLPPWLKGGGSGWVTAEYAMLPRSTQDRTNRDAAKKGRSLEISRLIGRSLRAVMDMGMLGERQIILDCDVLQADGGTRTAAITGAYVALYDAVQKLLTQGAIPRSPLLGQCAAISVGMVEGELRLDLDYEEDAAADVDLNLVMRDDHRVIEVQGCAEGEPFSRDELNRMLTLGEKGIEYLFIRQREALGLA
ncbi:MAG: ribonuclease PH [Candidatus Hydrogenedentota bacterium]